MSDTSSEPPEKWQRVLAAAKATQKLGDPSAAAGAGDPDPVTPPKEFSHNLIGRLRAFHASLASWQRWSLLAGLISILIFIASFIYLKSTSTGDETPIIETPALDLPQPATPTNP